MIGIMRRVSVLLAGFSITLLSGCASSPSGGLTIFPQTNKLLEETKALKAAQPVPVALPRELNKGVALPFVVEPGDALSLTVGDPNSTIRLPGDQPVLLDGTIDLGQYGRVLVAHKTLKEIDAIIKEAVGAKEKKVVPIEVRLANKPVSKVAYILGDVNTPGAYALDGRETMLDAILLAGGLTGKADHDNIILIRPSGPCECRVVLPICYDEIVQWGDATTNYQLLPGDRVYVPTKPLMARIFPSKRKRVCAPCGKCPTACMLPPEKCEGAVPGAFGAGVAGGRLPAKGDKSNAGAVRFKQPEMEMPSPQAGG